MAITQNTYTGDGSTVLFSFTFPYLDAADIKISLDGSLTTAYTLANATTIQFNTPPANGVAIRIYRVTDESALSAQFYPGSAIRSQDLNDNFTQSLYVTQEAFRDSTQAVSASESAIATANTALSNSNTALNTANAVFADLTNALSTANTADANASAAVAAANTANANASAAVTTANTANANASAALATANTADANASAALATANTAIQPGDASVITSAMIAAGTIVDGDINASAAIADTKLGTIATAGKVSNSATTATDANTASTIVARDASGNFAAGTITADLVGNAATATKLATAKSIALSGDVTGSASFDGSSNVTITATVTNDSHNHVINTVDGLQTALDAKLDASSYTASDVLTKIKTVDGALSGLDADLLDGQEGSYYSNASNINAGTIGDAYLPATISSDITGNAATVTTNANLTGDITSVGNATSIAAGVIVNADINVSAAIAGTKISPNFGSQNVVTTGTSTAASFIPTSSTVPTNGVYLPSANNVAISTNGTGRLFIDASGKLGVGTNSPQDTFHLNTASGSTTARISSSTNTSGLQITARGDGTGCQLAAFGTSSDLRFFTTNSGGSTNEAVRITSTGTVNIVGAGTAGSTQAVSFNGSAPVNSVVLDSSGRLGLGTSSPGAKLHLIGDVRAAVSDGTSAGTVRYALNSDNGGYDMAQITATQGAAFTNPVFKIRVSDTSKNLQDRLTIDSSGRLGLGTSSPGSPIDLNYSSSTAYGTTTDTSPAINVFNTSGSTNAYAALKLSTYGTGSGVAVGTVSLAALPNATTYAADFAIQQRTTSGAFRENLRITHDGKLGVGTTSPISDRKLTVKNDGFSGGIAVTNTADDIVGQFCGENVGTSQELGIYSLSNMRLYTGGTQRATIDSSGRLLVGASTAVAATPLLQVEQTTGAEIALGRQDTSVEADDLMGGIGFWGRDTTGVAYTEQASVKCFADGTHTPATNPTRLVFSTTANGQSSPTPRMTIDSSGRVGVGTTSPGYALDVTGSINAYNGFLRIAGTSSPSGNDPHIYRPGTSAMGFWAGGSERMQIDSSGRLLLGTSSYDGNARVVVQGNTSSNTTGALVVRYNGTRPLSAGEGIGSIRFESTSQTNANYHYASISCDTDGASSSDTDIPGRLVFSTTADGASSPTERMRISNTGAFGINGANYGSSGQALLSQGSSSPPVWGSVRVDVQEFTSSGTWTKPTGAKLVYVEVIGAGGGGGSGRKQLAPSTSDVCGGGGGAGGMALRRWLVASDLGSTVAVTIGAGGAGGAGVTSASTNGNVGVLGGDSSFGTLVIAQGGKRGARGATFDATGGAGTVLNTNSTSSTYLGNAGGGNATIGQNGTAGYYGIESPGGGGGGGGLRGSDGFQRWGGEGGGGWVAYDNSRWGSSIGGGGAGGNELVVGLHGSAGANPGDGGGGGGGGNTVSGGNGGNGAFPGGGGGGGGATNTGTASGAGGAGANGVVRVYTYF